MISSNHSPNTNQQTNKQTNKQRHTHTHTHTHTQRERERGESKIFLFSIVKTLKMSIQFLLNSSGAAIQKAQYKYNEKIKKKSIKNSNFL